MLRKSLAELDRRRKNPDENQKGFTLIELLVVIIIIGILAAIAIPVFLSQRESAWKASVESDLKNAAVVVETFGTSHSGSYATFNTTGSATSTKAVPVAGLNVSEGNTITVTTTATSYKITGTNSNIAVGGGTFAAPTTSGFQLYDSAAGGLGAWQ